MKKRCYLLIVGLDQFNIDMFELQKIFNPEYVKKIGKNEDKYVRNDFLSLRQAILI